MIEVAHKRRAESTTLTNNQIRVRRIGRPVDRYVSVHNDFIRDTALSIEARGLGVWLLSHDEGFALSATSIQAAIKGGRDRARRLLGELEEAGYLVRERAREDGGSYVGMSYTMSDEKRWSAPSPENPSAVRPADSADDDHQGLDHQGLADQGLVEPSSNKKTNSEKTKNEKTNPPGGSAAAPDAEPEFSAKDVVAAYVDSFRLKSGGQDPVGRFIGQVGREAKKLIAEGRSSELLLRAATELGRTPYASLENQVTRLMTNAPAGVQTGKAEAHQPGLESRRNEENWQRLYAENPERFSVADMGLDDDGPAF